MSYVQHIFCAEIVVESGANTIIFDDGAARTATITPGSYCLYGDASESGNIDAGDSNGDLLAAIKTAMEAVSAQTYTLVYTAKVTSGGVTGEVVITQDSGSLHLDSGSTFDMTLLGFPAAGQDDGGASVTSSLSPGATWCSNSPPKIVYGSGAEHPCSQSFAPSGRPFKRYRASERTFRKCRIEHNHMDRTKKEGIASDEGRTFEAWREVVGLNRLRLYKKVIASSEVTGLNSTYLVGTYTLDAQTIQRFDPENMSPGQNLWGFDLLLRTSV